MGAILSEARREHQMSETGIKETSELPPCRYWASGRVASALIYLSSPPTSSGTLKVKGMHPEEYWGGRSLERALIFMNLRDLDRGLELKPLSVCLILTLTSSTGEGKCNYSRLLLALI